MDSKIWTDVLRQMSVWCIAERRECRAEREGDLAEELHSVERAWKWICGVLCSKTGVSAVNISRQQN